MGRPPKTPPKNPKKKHLSLVRAPSPAEIQKAEKQVEALKLRKSGKSYTEIALELHITQNQAGCLVRDALHEMVQEKVDDMRKIEASRYDELLARAIKSIEEYEVDVKLFHETVGKQGKCAEPKVIIATQQHILEISREYRKLWGIDKPLKIEATGTGVLGVGISDLLRIRDAGKANGVQDDPPQLEP